MRILFLTQIVPYPPDAGPKVKTWHVLRYLAKSGHEIVLASFMRREEEGHLEDLKKICAQVHGVPIRRSRIQDVFHLLRSQLSGRPFLIERDDLKEMRQLVDDIVHNTNVDCIISDQLTMTQFAASYSKAGQVGRRPATADHKRPMVVFDSHNAVWMIVDRMAKNANLILRPLMKQEAQRVKRYEAGIVRDFDLTTAVTTIDQQDLLRALADYYPQDRAETERKMVVFPITIDIDQLQPIKRHPDSTNIMTLGTLHYPPNADGIRWFAREVFPLVCQRVPAAQLTIVGKNPPPDFLILAEQHPGQITVTGYVPELRPYFEQARLVVVPVRAGSGMRVRILESFALGMPQVTTSVGLEGIEATPGEDILVADTPDDFAEAVIRLLGDEALQQKLSERGRWLAETCYDWRAALQGLDGLLQFHQES